MVTRQEPNDGDLVRVASEGDAVSLGLLLERHRAPLYALALHLVGSNSDAEDAVHETFLVALGGIGQVRNPDAVSAWLRAILRNVCRMRLRSARRELVVDEWPALNHETAPGALIEERIERLALRDWVWTALARLPEPLRVTALLRYFGRPASYEEIAATLGLPVGTVRSRLHQVKVKLGEALLETAELAPSDVRRAGHERMVEYVAATEELNRGAGYDLFAATFSDDLRLLFPGHESLEGRRHLVEGLEEDLRIGVKWRLTNVLASGDITILEGAFENPPDAPFHCPPTMTQVHFQRDGLTYRLHVYYSPRPSTEER